MVPDVRVLSLLTVRQVLDAREGRPWPNLHVELPVHQPA
jgi:hypothetical protein